MAEERILEDRGTVKSIVCHVLQEMLSMGIKTLYFEKASREHSVQVVEAVKEFLNHNEGIEHIVVATTEGTTGFLFAKEFSSKQVIVVTHQSGFASPDHNELSNEKRAEIAALGAYVLTATHAFAGVGRGIRKSLGTYTETEIIAYAFRTFGQGTKVCAEIAMMAADAGLVPVSKDVICVAGTGRGADTAWIIRPANTSDFTKLQMKACLCKPLEF
jgi:hypothetical protein